MLVIRNDNLVTCDVDDTLIGWDNCPIDRSTWVEVEFAGKTYHHWVLDENVASLRRHASRNQPIIVWSQGGHEWAEAVVKALGITDIVTAVMSKPKFVIDDLPASVWMPVSRLAEKK